MGDGILHLSGPDKKEGQSVVGARSYGVFLKDVAIGLRRFIGHADAGIGDSDLLQHNRIAGLLFEGESKRCESLMELPFGKEFHSLIIIVDPTLPTVTTEKLLPNGQ